MAGTFVELFGKAYVRLVDHERGFQNNRADRGNWTSGIIGVGELKGTNTGISAMSYPDEDIANMTPARSRFLYKRDYWDAAQADQYHPAIGFQIFDAGVHHGPGNARRFLQRAAGVNDDGIIGPVTLAAICAKDKNDILMRFNAYRLGFMTRVSNWDDFGKGYARRIVKNLLYSAEDN